MKSSLGLRLEDLLRQKNDGGVKAPALPSRHEEAQNLFSKGVALLKQGRHFDALGPLFAARELNPKLTKAANNLALAFWHLECPHLALALTREVLAHDPANAKAKENLAFMEDIAP